MQEKIQTNLEATLLTIILDKLVDSVGNSKNSSMYIFKAALDNHRVTFRALSQFFFSQLHETASTELVLTGISSHRIIENISTVINKNKLHYLL